MFSKVKSNGYRVDAAHKVVTEWYSSYRLVWAAGMPLRDNILERVDMAFLRLTVLTFILLLYTCMHILLRETKQNKKRADLAASLKRPSHGLQYARALPLCADASSSHRSCWTSRSSRNERQALRILSHEILCKVVGSPDGARSVRITRPHGCTT